MGDIIHTFPAATELRARMPDAEVHWLIEEAFVGLAGLHPGIDRIVPFGLRRWRKRLWDPAVRQEMRTFVGSLRGERYDIAIDSQGLWKSALVGKFSGAKLVGYTRHTVRDPTASIFYDQSFNIPPLHVIERNRMIVGAALGYQPEGTLDYGIRPPDLMLDWQPDEPFVVCLTATARAAKLWPEEKWIRLGQWLRSQGLVPIFPWGSEDERQRSIRLVNAIPGGCLPPRFSLVEGARLLADARAAVGVDTGLMHMAAAVGTPTVGIFCDSDPHHAAPRAGKGQRFAESLGGVQNPPTVEAVLKVLESSLKR